MEAKILARHGATSSARAACTRAVGAGPRAAADRRVGARGSRTASSRGEQTVVGVNAYQVEEDRSARPALAEARSARRCARTSPRSRRTRRRARRRRSRARSTRSRAPRSDPQAERLRAGGRGGRGRLHARRDLRARCGASWASASRWSSSERTWPAAHHGDAAAPLAAARSLRSSPATGARIARAITRDRERAAAARDALLHALAAAPRPRARASASPARRAPASRR